MESDTLSPPSLTGSWKVKAITATRGNQTMIGAVVCAILGQMPGRPPRFAGLATIWDNGRILVDGQMRGQTQFAAVDIGTVAEVNDSLRKLADHCRFTDDERKALFTEFSKWIERDLRAKSTLD